MKSKRYHSDREYIDYMRAYADFYAVVSKNFGACPRLDSQFSESIAADYFDFTLKHVNGYDGYTDSNQSCEVKGTGFTNSKVHFSLNVSKASHIFWVRTNKEERVVEILEIEVNYSGLDARGFIDLAKSKEVKILKRIGILIFCFLPCSLN